MDNLANTIETLRTAKTTKATYNRVLKLAQTIIENRAITFIEIKETGIGAYERQVTKTYEQDVICNLCDLLRMNLDRPSSFRTPMDKLVTSAKNIALHKLGL